MGGLGSVGEGVGGGGGGHGYDALLSGQVWEGKERKEGGCSNDNERGRGGEEVGLSSEGNEAGFGWVTFFCATKKEEVDSCLRGFF